LHEIPGRLVKLKPFNEKQREESDRRAWKWPSWFYRTTSADLQEWEEAESIFREQVDVLP
jgi:hypothetical protein